MIKSTQIFGRVTVMPSTHQANMSKNLLTMRTRLCLLWKVLRRISRRRRDRECRRCLPGSRGKFQPGAHVQITGEDHRRSASSTRPEVLSFMGQLAKDKNTQTNSTPGKSHGGGRGGGRGRGGSGGPCYNLSGQDDNGQKEVVKQQASRAATQPSKRGEKSGKESGSDHEQATDSEYPENEYRACAEGMRLGTRVKIYEDEVVERMNLYGKRPRPG
jgi:hypothetical protein